MKKGQLKSCIPGIIVVAIGGWFLYLSLRIRDNPVKIEDKTLNFLAQARFLPLMVSVVLIMMGLLFAVQLYKGKATCESGMTKGMFSRELILTVITVAYLIVTSKVGFLYPTIVYLAGMLFYLNWNKNKWWVLLIITAVFTFVTIYLTPLILQLKIKLV